MPNKCEFELSQINSCAHFVHGNAGNNNRYAVSGDNRYAVSGNNRLQTKRVLTLAVTAAYQTVRTGAARLLPLTA